jgi:hypothetical protein
MAIKNPVRAEVVRDLLDVISADYVKGVVKEPVPCPECGGEGVRVYDVKAKLRKKQVDRALSTWGDEDAPPQEDETDKVEPCGMCKGEGHILMEAFDFSALPKKSRQYVTGFKTGPRGMLIPEMRNKDKAVAELIKAISAGWVTAADFKRDQYGNDVNEEDVTTKEGLIAAYTKIALTADPATAMNALNQISKLKGFLTEDDDSIDSQPVTMQHIQGFFNGLLQNRGHQLPPANGSGDSGAGNGEAGPANGPRSDDEDFGEGFDGES